MCLASCLKLGIANEQVLGYLLLRREPGRPDPRPQRVYASLRQGWADSTLTSKGRAMDLALASRLYRYAQTSHRNVAYTARWYNVPALTLPLYSSYRCYWFTQISLTSLPSGLPLNRFNPSNSSFSSSPSASLACFALFGSGGEAGSGCSNASFLLSNEVNGWFGSDGSGASA